MQVGPKDLSLVSWASAAASPLLCPLPTHAQGISSCGIFKNLACASMSDMRRRGSWKIVVVCLSELCSAAVPRLLKAFSPVQAPLSGGATFSAGLGRSGVARFSTSAGPEPGMDWQTLFVEDQALRVAAEVVVGRSDLRDLTALGMPQIDADEVRPRKGGSLGRLLVPHDAERFVEATLCLWVDSGSWMRPP